MTHRPSSLRFLALMAVLGCAHAAVRPPASSASSHAPTRAPAVPVAPTELDRSEEITAAELASIPDPVPATAETRAGSDSTPAADSVTVVATAPSGLGVSGSASGIATGSTGSAAPGIAGAAVWRVQIFASPDLAQAGRVAREASAKLGTTAVVEYEGSLYKVRLGVFGSEAEAQTLRDRAVTAGYPGAFRMQVKQAVSN
ncbi:MAG: SPOR domain-containing protein [Candidatus Eiseniibacteriota bacterium]